MNVAFESRIILILALSTSLAACHHSSQCGCCEPAGTPSQGMPTSVGYTTAGHVTTEAEDLRAQQRWYQANKAMIDTTYSGKWIVIVANQVFAADDIGSAEVAAMKAFPGRQFFATVVPRPAYYPGQPVAK